MLADNKLALNAGWDEEIRKQSWLRQPGESARAYQAARIYFDLRGPRSLAAVAQKLCKSLTLIKRRSTRWDWVGRALAFDLYMDAAEIEATRLQAVEASQLWAKRDQQTRELKYDIGQKMRAKANAMLDFPLATVTKVDSKTGEVTIVKPARWSMGDTVRMSESAYRLIREAIRNEGSIDGGGDLRDETFTIKDYK
jgi:hypothetical protein